MHLGLWNIVYHSHGNHKRLTGIFIGEDEKFKYYLDGKTDINVCHVIKKDKDKWSDLTMAQWAEINKSGMISMIQVYKTNILKETLIAGWN